MGGLCEKSPPMSAFPGTVAARDSLGMAADAIKHSTHKSSPVNARRWSESTSTSRSDAKVRAGRAARGAAVGKNRKWALILGESRPLPTVEVVGAGFEEAPSDRVGS